MSKALGMRCVWGLCGVLASALVFASVTRAEVSSDLSGSVLVYTKVMYTQGPLGRDTVIQLSNTSNNLVGAHCFYVNARLVNGVPLCQVTDFKLWLTQQQATHWVASQGRVVNPMDGFGNDGSGLDPGSIPPVPPGFVGELKCIQVESSEAPFGGNNLKGEAVLRRADGDVSKYNAVAILANPDLASGDPANQLMLNNTPLNDGEFNSCANSLLLDHFLDGATGSTIQSLNPAWCVDDDCPIRPYLTLVPCQEDFENLIPEEVTVQFAITNEFEESFSASTTVDCWLTTRLADIDAPSGTCTGDGSACQTDEQCIASKAGFCNKNSVFSLGAIGSGTAYTKVTPVGLDGGVIGVIEEEHFNNNGDAANTVHSAWAAANTQQRGTRFDATGALEGGPRVDTITIPLGF